MANNVFANGREISCKKADGKSICSFPDVCFTPPENPATPPGVPIPYPNTGMAKDTTSGSKKVQISKKEVLLKNKSYFKKSMGDEAGAAAKKGVLTSTNRGKVYFTMWSMDVKVEAQNVVRHLDLTTHNHMSQPGNTPPWMYADRQAFVTSQGKVCKDEEEKADKECSGAKPSIAPKKGLDCTDECKAAQKCTLKPKKDDKSACCADDTTGHHLIEVHCFSPTGARGSGLEDLEKYNQRNAPCVCASESRADGTHGVLHAVQSQMEGAYNAKGTVYCEWLEAGKKVRGQSTRDNAVSNWRYNDARDAGCLAHKTAFPHCNAVCIKAQLDDYHKGECGMDELEPLRSDPGAASRSSGTLSASQQSKITNITNSIRGVGSGTGL